MCHVITVGKCVNVFSDCLTPQVPALLEDESSSSEEDEEDEEDEEKDEQQQSEETSMDKKVFLYKFC